MCKLIFVFCTVFFLACKNNSTPANGKAATLTNSSSNTAKTWSKEDELEFIDGCVGNAQEQLGATQAYSLCKCMLVQVKEKFAAADSIAIATHLSDTAQITQMMRKCR